MQCCCHSTEPFSVDENTIAFIDLAYTLSPTDGVKLKSIACLKLCILISENNYVSLPVQLKPSPFPVLSIPKARVDIVVTDSLHVIVLPLSHLWVYSVRNAGIDLIPFSLIKLNDVLWPFCVLTTSGTTITVLELTGTASTVNLYYAWSLEG